MQHKGSATEALGDQGFKIFGVPYRCLAKGIV